MKQSLPNIIPSLILFIIALTLSEVILRGFGFGPWPTPVEDTERSVVADKKLGWVASPGVRTYRALVPDAPDFGVTVWPSGARATRPKDAQSGTKIVLLGGSFVFGFGLDDHDTFGWHLQQAEPNWNVVNHAVAGYGTYQALLVMRRVLSRESGRVPIFVYGFNDFHETRNVGDPEWLKSLAHMSPRKNISLPFCRLGEAGRLRCREGRDHYPEWPLRNHLSLVTLAEEVYVRVRDAGAQQEQEEVTRLLLKEMHDLAAKRDAKLLVSYLSMSDPGVSAYTSFLEKLPVRSVDCRHPNRASPEYQIPGDEHPSGEVHRYWADCVAPIIKESLSPDPLGSYADVSRGGSPP